MFTGAGRRAPKHYHRHLLKESVVALSEGVISRAVLKLQVPDARAPGYDLADVDRLVVFGVTLLEGGAPFCILIRGEAKTNAVLSAAAIYPRAGLHMRAACTGALEWASPGHNIEARGQR